MSRRRMNRKKGRNPGLLAKSQPLCRNCGERGPHFVPPSFGDPGFYICKRSES
jgi:hypothetical protein